MAKRFTATEIWSEDWFLEMPTEYKLFWYYMLSACDHSGLFRVNLRSFCALNEVNLTSTQALEYFNFGKNRIRVIAENVWFIEDFFVYQYGTKFNFKNRVHKSISEIYVKYKIKLTSIRGLIEVKDGDKDKDKDKDKDNKKGGTGEKEEGDENGENYDPEVFPMTAIYNRSYEDIDGVFKDLSEKEFLRWKKFVDFIFKNGFEEIFNCTFLNPVDLKKLDFPEDRWDDVLRGILGTGVKPEHNLFFRIPQFLNYGTKATNGSTKPGTSVSRVAALKKW